MSPARLIVPDSVWGALMVPPCPHPGCDVAAMEATQMVFGTVYGDWAFGCPRHGNADMVFTFVKQGALTCCRADLNAKVSA